jgi:phosphoglycolate phosphatase-like HAD superfamily hydrolase
MNLFIFDLDGTLIDENENLIISLDALSLLKDMKSTGEYEFGIASFNVYTQEILEKLEIKNLFKYISCGILLPNKEIHPYNYSKIDNLLYILDRCEKEYKNIVFFDNNLENCKHVRDYLKIPYVCIRNDKGLNYSNVLEGLDIIDYKKYKKNI